MSNRIVVSRHPAAAEFIARELGGEFRLTCGDTFPHGWVRLDRRAAEAIGWHWANEDADFCGIRVIHEATPEDVREKIVYGNLPLHLACLADTVYAIEFAGAPPRGGEYTLADMDAAGARLAAYRVRAIESVYADELAR